ncbi:UTP--glucose-1-phosphate uridylyltransferase [Fulvimarina sp. 2208YS6-2-32]|uniref:UTP--glucose-1-phosphate uridylyltransferase n=1 Tax=Fulvimarina uroteuthidis TaxID=3098149 RepID=A0ABU5I5Z5_9HYPH|nr:UTP--glucose-1-phosphate uridylyltransferase [Fulvimarina sp. 2208YS6-2-32]MDY8110804.1 UTP--glucose-1-phosphate uridylyltransferase [Fulvimarina sp. 2208YS6-2-32]
MRTIRKAVFPVAGLGTRFLPATKSVPKEMLTIVDRPVIQYVVDEAWDAGIEHLIFVTGRNKGVIEDYFDVQTELVDTLVSRGKTEQLTVLSALQPKPGMASFTRQQAPLGLGHAVWCARELVGDEPFAVLLPDMVMKAQKGCLASMVEFYNVAGGNILSVDVCDPNETDRYGIVGKGQDMGKGFRVTDMVEKPKPATAPSNYSISGRYILQPEIFNVLETQERGMGGEIQLTDAMRTLAMDQAFAALPFDGTTFDCGSKEGFIEANVAFALDRSDVCDTVGRSIARMLRQTHNDTLVKVA